MKHNVKMRSVKVNGRGQFVIPEEFRKDWGLNVPATLIAFKRDEEIVLKKEKDVLKELQDEEKILRAFSIESMKTAWDEEDEVWDDIYKKFKEKE